MSNSKDSKTEVSIALSSDNYEAWNYQMKDYLMKRKVWWTITEVVTQPEQLDAFARVNGWKKLDEYQLSWRLASAEAIQIMSRHSDPTRRMDIKRFSAKKETAYNVWEGLRKLYEASGPETWCEIMSNLVLQ